MTGETVSTVIGNLLFAHDEFSDSAARVTGDATGHVACGLARQRVLRNGGGASGATRSGSVSISARSPRSHLVSSSTDGAVLEVRAAFIGSAGPVGPAARIPPCRTARHCPRG
ncbi:hypothetical protein SAMN04488085_103412 [Geodermatophilus ruber]|uniref:Uncharacterized protein n=1 Tax=Geodermatophilus ruber TaxID=504800 RepID=A0A1I4CAF7_9ACTN|nr:hypothetical protein SAMN04488085_103412 [Geodermatophilus ruber]